MSRELGKNRGLEPEDPFVEQPVLGRILPQEVVGVQDRGGGGGKHSKEVVRERESKATKKSEKAGAAADAAQGKRRG